MLKSIKSTATGRSYCFQVSSLLFAPDDRRMLLNQYFYEMEQEPFVSGGELFVSLNDLIRIFSPDWAITADGLHCFEVPTALKVDCRIVRWGEKTAELPVPPIRRKEQIFVPVAALMERVFGFCIWHVGKYLGVSCTEEERLTRMDGPGSPPCSESRLNFKYQKNYGDLHFTCWFEEGKRLNNYRMYVPFSYDGTRPFKLLVVLHGGNGNSDAAVFRSRQKLQYLAEWYGYIVLAPNSYVHGSNYGSLIPPLHMFPEPAVKSPVPNYYTAAEEAEFAAAQRCLEQVLEYVLSNWNIDRENIYVMGNSMGSCGTFHLLGTYPTLFRAGVPTACMPLTEYLNPEPLRGKPIWFLIGTEDPNDPAETKRRADELRTKGVDIRFDIIGGGYHSDAWVLELERIFEFFETVSRS